MESLDELTLDQLLELRDELMPLIRERIRKELDSRKFGDPPRLPPGEMSKMVERTGLSPTQLNRIWHGVTSGSQ